MRSCVILNPGAGTAEEAQGVIAQLAGRPDVVIGVTRAAGDAGKLAEQALEQGCELVIAAGGDGTINEVINGLNGNFGGVTLGIIPLGTGNDLARTLAIPIDPEQALAILDERRERRIDLIKVESQRVTVLCHNMAAGGFTGQMNEAMTDELKESWGPLSYLRGAAGVIPDITGYETTIALDAEPLREVDALNIIVANGRTAAGGFRLAPLANLEDGLLEVVVVRHGSLFDLASVAARLLTGSYLESEHVDYCRARRVRIVSRPGMWFNIDGELLTQEPISFSIMPQALRVVVGPGYIVEPPAI